MYTLYGIPNCSNMKKAQDWLEENKVPYRFHNYKKEGISEEKLQAWCDAAGWEALVNKKGRTWRVLPEDVKSDVKEDYQAVVLMELHNSVIKRPVIERDGKFLTVGFDEDTYIKLFHKQAL